MEILAINKGAPLLLSSKCNYDLENKEDLSSLIDVIQKESSVTQTKFLPIFQIDNGEQLAVLVTSKTILKMRQLLDGRHLRSIVIDGFNVAMEPGFPRKFELNRLCSAIRYFIYLGFKDVKAVINDTLRDHFGDDYPVIKLLEKSNFLINVPESYQAFNYSGRKFCADYAHQSSSILVTNDKYIQQTRFISKPFSEYLRNNILIYAMPDQLSFIPLGRRQAMDYVPLHEMLCESK
ncbi:hypothetical protein ACOME3_004368 [Neoechinorhynchus agilis]